MERCESTISRTTQSTVSQILTQTNGLVAATETASSSKAPKEKLILTSKLCAQMQTATWFFSRGKEKSLENGQSRGLFRHGVPMQSWMTLITSMKATRPSPGSQLSWSRALGVKKI